jgi:hypothetical protein
MSNEITDMSVLEAFCLPTPPNRFNRAMMVLTQQQERDVKKFRTFKLSNICTTLNTGSQAYNQTYHESESTVDPGYFSFYDEQVKR